MNKTDIERDFKKRYGNGDVHTCFVPIPLTIMGSGCYLHRGSTLMTAMNAGVWICARINGGNTVTIGSTSGNVSVSAPYYEGLHEKASKAYKLLFTLARRFNADCGFDVLFHCDIPECACFDTELSRCVGAAMLMQDIFSDKNEDIPSLVSDLADSSHMLLAKAVLSARINHAVYMDGDAITAECVPICPEQTKIICAYPSKKHLQRQANIKNLNISSPMPLNEIKLDSIPDKSGSLHSLAVSSQNTLAAFKSLKNNGIEAFFNTFADDCDIDGCVGKFESDTEIYFTEENRIDYVLNEINRRSPSTPSFIITNCEGGARIF